MASQLDQVQLIKLSRERKIEGDNYTPTLLHPRDMANYFIYVGNEIASEAVKSGDANPTIIRYSVNVPYVPATPENDAEVIRKHCSVFRTKITYIRNALRKEKKTLKKFKAIFHSGYRFENTTLFVYAWEFRLNEKVNSALAALGNELFVEGD